MQPDAGSAASLVTGGPAKRGPLLLVAWAVCVGAVSLLGNGDARPLDEHEILVARTTTEMARRRDWVLPYFSGEPRLQKLPLNYWLTYLSARLLGEDPAQRVDAFVARFPSAVAALVLTCLIGWCAAKWRGNWQAALVAASLLGTSNGLIAWAHNARPEMVYATFCGLQTLAFAQALQSGTAVWAFAGWLAALAATMAKGPHYPALLLLAMLVAGWSRLSLPETLRRLRPGLGAVLFAAGLGGYVYLLAQHVDGLASFWYRELFYRTGGVEGLLWFFRFYYVQALVQLTLPWSFLAVSALVWAWRRRRTLPLSLWACWMAVVLPALVLSFSRGQRAYYLLPSLAPCFLLTAWVVQDYLEGRLTLLGRPVPVRWFVLGHLAVVGGLALFVVGRAALYVQAGWVPRDRMVMAVMLVALALAGAVFVWVRWRGEWGRYARLLPTCLLVVYAAGCVTGAFWSSDRYRRARMAKIVVATLDASVPVYALAGRREHLVYYWDRPVRRLTHTEAALLRDLPAYVLIDERCGKCIRLFGDAPVVKWLVEPENRYSIRWLASPTGQSSLSRTAGSQAATVLRTSSAVLRSPRAVRQRMSPAAASNHGRFDGRL